MFAQFLLFSGVLVLIYQAVLLKPIGHINSEYLEKFAIPRQPGLTESIARIRLINEVQPTQALSGIDEYSHIWLIFGFHEAKYKYSPVVRPPRLGPKKAGVFATRSPHRANPLGLSVVELLRIDGVDLVVKGADLLNGTPIYDIKPYLPEIESIPNARFDERYNRRSLRVTWAEHLKGLPEDLRQNIQRHIELDPRPKGNIERKSHYGLRLANTNVRFRVSGNHAEIIDIENIRIDI